MRALSTEEIFAVYQPNYNSSPKLDPIGDQDGTDNSNPGVVTTEIEDSLADESATNFSALYVAPDGNDSNPGTESYPWQTLRFAISQLKPGNTLYVKGGTYYENSIDVDVSGTESERITITNYPGETPIIDGGYLDFRTAGNNDWQLYDATRNIYRSVRTYANKSGVVGGYFGPDNGSYRLVPYEDFGPFSTDNEEYAEKYPYYYVGPGVYWDRSDERIYIRLKHSKYQASLNLPVPADTDDPRQISLFIFPYARRGIDFTANAAYITFEGIDVRYTNNALHFSSSANNIRVSNSQVKGGRYHIVVRNNVHDLVFDNITIIDTFPPWVAWSDVKMPSNGRPAHRFQGAGLLLLDTVWNIEIKNSTFQNLFDGILAPNQPINVHVHHNTFDTIRDDVFQLGSEGYDIEVSHNTMTKVFTSVAWHGGGNPPPGKVGTKYIHHNVIDTSIPELFGRTDPNNIINGKLDGFNGDGMATHRAFGNHAAYNRGPDPWKIYHNTIKFAKDSWNRGSGAAYFLVNLILIFPMRFIITFLFRCQIIGFCERQGWPMDPKYLTGTFTTEMYQIRVLPFSKA